MLVTWTKRANALLSLLSLFFRKIRGAASTLGGNHNPTVKKIILANFIK